MKKFYKKQKMKKKQEEEKSLAIRRKGFITEALEAVKRAEEADRAYSLWENPNNSHDLVDLAVTAAREYKKAGDLFSRADDEDRANIYWSESADNWEYVCGEDYWEHDYHYEWAEVLFSLCQFREAADTYKKSAELAKDQTDRADALEAAVMCLESLLRRNK